MPAQIGWVLLRKEVLQRIAAQLDSESLFNLGRTCRSLNHTVFAFYIGQNQPERGYHGFLAGHLSAPTYHPEGLLTAFRCSLMHHKCLKSVNYGFSATKGFRGVLQDLRELYTIFSRQPREMGAISLYLSQLDHAVKQSSPALCLGYRPTEATFRDRLCSVIDCAVQKGARFLDVWGGFDALQSLTSTDAPGQSGVPMGIRGHHAGPNTSLDEAHLISSSSTVDKTGSRARRHDRRTSRMRNFFSSLSDHLRVPSSGAPVATSSASPAKGHALPPLATLSLQSPSFTTRPSLEDIHIRTDLLFSPAFRLWTLDLLRANAETLNTLKIECSILLHAACHAIFVLSSFPKLRKLEISVAPFLVQQQAEIYADNFASFLSRCQAIEQVVMYCIKPACPSPDVLRGLQMSHITSFSGHPSDVLWILQLPSSAVPNLRQVALTADCHGPQAIPNYLSTNNVLKVLNTDDRDLVVGFRLKAERSLDIWLQDRIAKRELNQCYPLKKIRTLTMEFSWSMHFDDARIETLCKFINTFPNVERVTLDQLLWLNKVGDQGSAEVIKGFRLANFKTVKVNHGPEIVLKTDFESSMSRSLGGIKLESGSKQTPGPPMT